jgi:dihydrofolate reductase
LGTLAAVPGLVDEHLVVIHPAVLSAGPRMFDGIGTDLALRLTGARVFDGGTVVLRYATTWNQVPAAYEASGGHPS